MDGFFRQLGKNVRSLREERGMLQTDLARAAHTTQATVARLESGLQNPSIILVLRVAFALEVSINELLEQCVLPPLDQPMPR